MNKTEELLEAALATLQGYGLNVHQSNGELKKNKEKSKFWFISVDAERTRFVVESRLAVSPANLDAVSAQIQDRAERHGCPVLLLANSLTQPLQQELVRRNVYFLDTAGNANIRGAGLLLRVTGNKATTAKPKPPKDLYTGAALKIVFALMCKPDLAAHPQRELAKAANVALGSVSGVISTLKDARHLLESGKTLRLYATKRLLDEWVMGYLQRLHAKTLVASYVTENFDRWRDWDVQGHRSLWGGEPAAALLCAYLKPGILTLYADRLPPKLLAKEALIKTDHPPAQRRLDVRKPFWNRGLGDETARCVPPVLVYANLLATGDGRCIETSRILYDEHLAGLFPDA